MADFDESQFSLMSLEDELTCSICLSTFNCPVTIPCGHNFCQDCLLETWKDSYSCPQCRTLFATKPELKKNTVLSTVVETFNSRASKKETTVEEEESKADDVIRCDTCMEAEASQTCLTCMASFCEEHLRPHRENPKFSVHQLTELVGDLSERICQDHHKLMEFFCSQHGRPICSFCLQQAHKGCSFMTPEEQRNLKESDLRDKLGLLDGKIEKTETVMLQISDMQSKLKDAATNRKMAFAAVYQQMRDMLAQEEHKAQHDVDNELETAQTKLQDFMKRFTENSENMRKAREDLNSLLNQTQSLAFLKASFDLPRVVKFDPYAPRVHLDSKKVMASQAFAAALKERLTEILTQPVEARSLMLKPGEHTDEKAAPVSGNTGSQSESEPKGQPSSHSFGCPPMQPYFQPVPVPVYMEPPGGWNPSHYSQGQSQGSHRGPPFMAGQKPYKKSDTSHHSFNKQDRKPHTAPAWDGPKRDNPGGNNPSGKGHGGPKRDNPGGNNPSGKGPGGPKRDNPGGNNPSGKGPGGPKRDNPGGNNPSGKGPDGPKRDNPRSHPPSGKSAKSHPRPNKNN